MDNKSIELSIVIPLFNEEGNIASLYQTLKSVLTSLDRVYEIVFVNDGSTDDTLDRLISIASKDSDIVIVSLAGNSGQTGALSAGFDHAQGNTIITMDGDLQHDPNEIPEFLKWIDEGYDIVSGWRKHRIDPYLSRKLPSRIANYLMAKVSGISLHDFGTTFKAYRKEVLDNVLLYGEFHRFIPALVEGMRVRIKEIPIRSIPRSEGKSKYNINRTFTVFFDLIRIRFLTHYLNRPLQIFGSIGVVIGLCGGTIALYLAFLKFTQGISIMQYRAPLFLLSILLMLVGTQFLTMGLLGEIMVKLYYKLPGTKIYCLDRVIHFNQSRSC